MSTLKPSKHKSKHVAPGEYPEFVIFYTAAEHWMDFIVIAVGGWEEVDGKKVPILGDGRDIDSADRDEILMEGSIKWDGCINLDIGGRGESYRNHFCGLYGALIVERAMQAIYALAAQNVARFDAECAK